MDEVFLIGLRADNLQGWLAAVGTLMILDRQGLAATMHWSGVTPVLRSASKNEVIDVLWDYHPCSDILTNLPAGYGGEKTSLDVTGGTVIFDKVIEKTHAAVTKESISQALVHPWRNGDDVTSLGWDINALKQGSRLAGNKPPDKARHQGVVAGQWLAAESLPLTSYLRRDRRKQPYRWTTWGLPLDQAGVRAVVLAQPGEFEGVQYEADVYRNGQVGYFGLARTLSGTQNPGRLAQEGTAYFQSVYSGHHPV
ncbi:hypothetical protein [Chlorobium sp. N1]|uniref:hypothetical protein n=1 Tax=Chlorobium sp. N1 TaxID=2491138 RepID=UPI00103F9551|nr:hypothetical protein [Chlorobium sp. N1]TCD47194.1 hypothetical protein E0L29_08845 [Chlorobium sp. N1]